MLVFGKESKGDLKVRKWMDRFSTALLELEGRGSRMGPIICNEKGVVLVRSVVNDELCAVLPVLPITSNIKIEDQHLWIF